MQRELFAHAGFPDALRIEREGLGILVADHVLTHFSATFDGVAVFSNTNMALQNYGLVTVSGIASGSSTVLSFSGFNVPDSTGLDDVSVVATVPEPSSLMLLGSGALGLIGVIRRKLRA